MRSARHSKNRVNKIFGTELPQESLDERAAEVERSAEEYDRWLRDNVPPHHN